MKQTTIDQGVLKMALVGFQLQRNRIDAAIAKIQAELGQEGPRPQPAPNRRPPAKSGSV